VGAAPALTSVYGAFSIVPILLLWVYLLWVVVLLGAVMVAYAPELSGQAARQLSGAGRDFRQALAVLGLLEEARGSAAQGLDLPTLTQRLRADAVALAALLEQLATLGWVSRLDEPAPPRWVLLADPRRTRAAALVEALLVAPDVLSAPLRARLGMDNLMLADLLPGAGAADAAALKRD